MLPGRSVRVILIIVDNNNPVTGAMRGATWCGGEAVRLGQIGTDWGMDINTHRGGQSGQRDERHGYMARGRRRRA